MLTKVRDYILHQHLIEPGETVQVGVSGGADSVCLLYVLSQLRSDLQFELEAVHVNHNLRSTAHRDEDLPQGSVGSGGSPAESYPWMSCPGDSVSAEGLRRRRGSSAMKLLPRAARRKPR